MNTFSKIIETERLILRPFTMDDVEASYQMNLDREVTRYTNDGGVKTKEEIHYAIQNHVLGDYRKYGFGRFAIILKEEDKFIGFSGLKYLPEYDLVDIGYRFIRNYWGKGFATESAMVSMEFGFKELKLPKIIGLAMPENKASLNVFKKLQLTFEKELMEDGVLVWQYERKTALTQ